jgi:hypothetical protein
MQGDKCKMTNDAGNMGVMNMEARGRKDMKKNVGKSIRGTGAAAGNRAVKSKDALDMGQISTDAGNNRAGNNRAGNNRTGNNRAGNNWAGKTQCQPYAGLLYTNLNILY